MPASNRVMIHKLQNAINNHGGRILYEKTQFFSTDQKRPVSLYRISQSLEVDENTKRKKEKLFESSSMIQVVLYLRDLWYFISGQEIPTDNEMWEAVKAQKHIDYSLVKIWENE